MLGFRNGQSAAPQINVSLLEPMCDTRPRFHKSVVPDPARVGRDAGKIGDEVVSHLAEFVESSVKVTLEIEFPLALLKTEYVRLPK